MPFNIPSIHKKPLLIILLLTALTFGNSLLNGFVGDDNMIVVNNDFYRSLSNLPKIFTPAYITDSDRIFNSPGSQSGSVAYRPILSLTFFADYALWGKNPFGYHLTNLLLHVVNAILVYFLVFSILENPAVAFWSALLFSLHPLKSEPVCSIGYRADSLMTLFILCSFLSYLRYIKNILQRKQMLALSWFFYGLALFTKEAAVIYPLLIAAYHQIFRVKWKKGAWIGFILLTLLYIYLYLYIFPNQALKVTQLLGGGLPAHVLTMVQIFGEYLLAFIAPFSVKTLPPLHAPAITEKIGVSFVTIILFFVLFIKISKRDKKIFFFILWFWISLIPVSNLIPLINPMAYRFLYLPSIGLSVALAYFAVEYLPSWKIIQRNKNAQNLLKIGFIILCIVHTMTLNTAWRNGYINAKWMTQDHPESPIGYLHLGIQYFHRREFPGAIEALEKAIDLGLEDPRGPQFLALCRINDLDRAQILFEDNILNYPQYAASYVGLGRVYYLRKDLQKAANYFQEALRLAPSYSAYGYMIQIYLLEDDQERARDLLEEAKRTVSDPLQLESLTKFFSEKKENFPIDIGI